MIVESYLHALNTIHDKQVGTDELTYYPPLINLLNAVGNTLSPKIQAMGNLTNIGAGHPDAGLFNSKQAEGSIPERGVVEVKGTAANVLQIAQSAQVAKYLQVYRQVLVTNYWHFALVVQQPQGGADILETYQLAHDENTFWQHAAQPHTLAQIHAEPLVEFLKRVMLHPAMLSRPQDVAWFLASYARDALTRLADENLPGLNTIRTALAEALGLTFKDEQSDQFFKSTLIQTLFYGIFSAWVLWHKHHPVRTDRFDWRTSAYELHVPIMQVLFEQLSAPSKLHALGLLDVLNLVGNVLNRVDRAEFFAHFAEGEAVQYFYEPFLEAFSPTLRKDLGVWYTPPEVVIYMVERVDTILREEFGFVDGLADERVYVLDPCCGTGAYLVAVLQKIAARCAENGMATLTGAILKKAATERVFGFEILPAPFVIAHLQIGVLLQQYNAAFGHLERAGVYLTNALTGWNLDAARPAQQQTLPFKEFEAERDAAEAVKQVKPVLVVLGNPPYNAFAGVSPEEEQGLVDCYKAGLIDTWGIKKFNLDDLYIRFFRLAEHRIADLTGRGIVCYISSFSYLSDPSFVVMRQHLLQQFDAFWFDCLNGDSRETGKRTPDGKPDPSIFSTPYNRAGIRVGTTIGLLVRNGQGNGEPTVHFREFWGATKRQDLLESLNFETFHNSYKLAEPTRENRYSFSPMMVSDHYLEWPTVIEFTDNLPFNGPIERRGNSLIIFKEQTSKLAAKLEAYLNPEKSDAEVISLAPDFMKSSGEFDAPKTRAKLKGTIQYDPNHFTRYPFKPFDVRLAYLDSEIQPLFSRPSPDLLKLQHIPQNAFFITRDTADKREEGIPFFFSRRICDYDCVSGHARHFPFLLYSASKKSFANQTSLFSETEIADIQIQPNISKRVQKYLSHLGITRDQQTAIYLAERFWFHVIAIGYSSNYLQENIDGIRIDWPHIPLPDSKESLITSAELGRQIAAILDTEQNVPTVTTGQIRPELRMLAVVAHVTGGQLNPAAGDLALNARWGYLQRDAITMPGPGTLTERAYTSAEREALAEGAQALGMSCDTLLDLLGPTTYDVYLNTVAYWRNIPVNVWNFTIGGYQVIKKWLSYREQAVLGRDLKIEEVLEVTQMVRRIAALILLQPQLDANYQKVKAATYAWPQP